MALGLAGEEYVPGVVIVVVPLPPVFANWWFLRRVEQACAVVAIFEHQMDVAVTLSGEVANRGAEIVQDRDFAGFNDGVDRIEPQPVETIFAKPIQSILYGEGAHLRHTIIDRAAPRRLRLCEKSRRIAAEVISFGTEVVVDHVQKHHQSAQMRLVDQGFEILGSSIGAVGRVPQYAVITPAARTRKIRKRHQFQRGY